MYGFTWKYHTKFTNKNLPTLVEDYYAQKELNIEFMVFGILKMKVNSQEANNHSSLEVQ